MAADLASRRVRATVGSETFEATLGTYGGRTFLGLRTAVLTALGVTDGDSVHVDLEPCTPADEPEAQPEPVASTELDEALRDDPPLAQAWAALPDGHRQEYGRWVAAGSDAEVRTARVLRLRHRVVRPPDEVRARPLGP